MRPLNAASKPGSAPSTSPPSIPTTTVSPLPTTTPLAGYENIRDFIACTTYAMLKRILDKGECQQLFGAAKIAMALLRAQARS
jgi:hypothetical protein